MKERLQQLRTNLLAKQLLLNQHRTERDVQSQVVVEVGRDKETLLAARKICEQARQLVIQSTHTRVEEIVTFAEQSVLADPTNRFAIEFLNRRNQFEVDIYNVRSGEEKEDLMEACGGTLCDVVATSLLVAVGRLLNIRTPLFLDEVGKHISPDMAPRFGQFLRDVSHKLERQIILVTHSAAVAEFADKRFHVTLEGGISRVKEE